MPTFTDITDITGVIVAILCGAAVGLERERSGHAVGSRARFGGIRTFTLLGVIAGVAGWLLLHERTAVAAILLAGAAALIVAAYARASLRDIDATTEVAAFVVLAAGVLCGVGEVYVGAGLTTITVLLLAEKPTLHALARRLDDKTLVAAARFAVMSIVVLPLLPTGPYGPPPGFRPRELWLLVLLFSALSFLGFIGRRLAGSAGYLLAGLLGGLVSSTSVTLAMARTSRTRSGDAQAMSAGAIAASTVLFLRIGVALAILNPTLVLPMVWYLLPPFAVGCVAAFLIQWKTPSRGQATADVKNPLEFRAAIEMAVLFQLVLYGVSAAQAFIGSLGVVMSGFILGLTDVDALTLAMARSADAITPEVATRAIAVGVLANTLLKATVAVVIGDRRFARYVCFALGAMAVALIASLLVATG
jgi:uncharacterized membrane protein (DUF4010 family)